MNAERYCLCSARKEEVAKWGAGGRLVEETKFSVTIVVQQCLVSVATFRNMPRLITTVLVLAAATATNGFTSTSSIRSHPSASSTSRLTATDDVAAAALSDYMAKAHDEKLKAMKQVEDKKNAEISVSCRALIGMRRPKDTHRS